MAADGGSVFWVETPLTQVGKGIAGSSKMASDGGSVIFGGEPLTQMGKSRAQYNRKKEETEMIWAMWLLMTII